MEIIPSWLIAPISEPIGYVDSNAQTIGIIVITANTPFILSLDPGADFELNTDIIQSWMAVFQNSEGEVLGDTNYTNLLKEIHPYILDQQNGSILIQSLTDDELADLYAASIFD